MKKPFIILALMLVLALALGACTTTATDEPAPPPAAEEPTEEPVEEEMGPIEVMASWGGGEQAGFEEVLAAFTEETGIEVTYISERDLPTVLPAPSRRSEGHGRSVEPLHHRFSATDLRREPEDRRPEPSAGRISLPPAGLWQRWTVRLHDSH